MKVIFAYLLILLIFLGGCATTAKYEAQLNSLVGVSEDALIAAWGVPDMTYDMRDGKRAVAYMRKTTLQTGGTPYTVTQTTHQSGTIGDKPYSGTATTYSTEIEPVQKHKFSCKTTFIIGSNARVESWHHEGNNCVSP
jgi:hypothetical protein